MQSLFEFQLPHKQHKRCEVKSLDFSTSGRHLLLATERKNIFVFDIIKQAIVEKLRDPFAIGGLSLKAHTPRSRKTQQLGFVSTSHDGPVILWD